MLRFDGSVILTFKVNIASTHLVFVENAAPLAQFNECLAISSISIITCICIFLLSLSLSLSLSHVRLFYKPVSSIKTLRFFAGMTSPPTTRFDPSLMRNASSSSLELSL